MQIRPIASNTGILVPLCSLFAAPLQCLIYTIKAIWRAVVALIQTLFCCCARREEEVSPEDISDIFHSSLSESESDDSSEAEIATTLTRMQDLRIYNSPIGPQRLMFRYQDWIREQRFSNNTVQNLHYLEKACKEGVGETAQFACIAKKILMEQPRIFTFFRLSIISDQHPRLESGLSFAVKTGNIEPLVNALLS